MHIDGQVLLLWRQQKLIKSGESDAVAGQRQFSESMTRLKNDTMCCWSKGSMFTCCSAEPSEQSEGDRYAQELIATELDMMKQTIREVNSPPENICSLLL